MACRFVWFGAAFLLLCGGLVLFPSIDLWASGLFYRAGDGFFLADWPLFRILHGDLPYAVIIFTALLVIALIAALLRRRPVLGLDAKTALFLLLSLALGPGLTVNTIFKDHWGRARPVQIAEFGGEKKLTPAFVPTDQCARNCSFPAGDPSIGFYLVSAAFLMPGLRSRRWGIGGALALGAALGIARIAQGGHFLSDVVASGFLVFAMSWLLYRVIIVLDGIASMLAACRKPSLRLKYFLGFSIATAALFFGAYALLDQPLARFFYDADPTLRRVFAFITRFGDSMIYLVPLGIAILWALWTRRASLTWRMGFVFAVIAISGLIADILKPVFGRARPRLLLQDQIFGFSWHGAHSIYWSFPSGHAVTIVALATSLYVLYPPLWPAYATAALLVAASRVIIDAHYLSDVIAGAYLGFVTAWALAMSAKSNDIPLSLPREKSRE
jgi:lipid A 4'-phosphatase